MPRPSILTPLSVLVAGLVLVALLLPAGPQQPAGAQQLNPYPPAAASPPSYPGPASPVSATTPVTGTTSVPVTGSPVVTTPRPATPAPTTAVPTSRVDLSQQQTPQPVNPTQPGLIPTEIVSPTIDLATPESASPVDSPALVCAPGQPFEISGAGPPHTGYLLYFNGRVVSGGTTDGDGRFSILLNVGKELPGRYPVSVRVRGSSEELRTLTCTVPTSVATPQPS
jgi:hypothetical protein